MNPTTIDQMVGYLEANHTKDEVRKWRVIHDPEAIHQLRASGGSLMCPAIIGACGPSRYANDLPECAFWWRVDTRKHGWCSTLEAAKQHVEANV